MIFIYCLCVILRTAFLHPHLNLVSLCNNFCAVDDKCFVLLAQKKVLYHFLSIPCINDFQCLMINIFFFFNFKNTLVGLVLASQILILIKYKIFLGGDIDLDELEYIFSKEFRKTINISVSKSFSKGKKLLLKICS